MAEHHNEKEYLDAIRVGNKGTKAIADHVGVERQSADERLRTLADKGLVEKEKIGNSLAWSVIEENV